MRLIRGLLQQKRMADQNILVYFVALHVLLNFCVHNGHGKIFSRKSDEMEHTVIVDIQDNKIDLELARKKRDTEDGHFGSGPTNISNAKNSSVLFSTVFEIPDKHHSRAVVHWSGINGKVSVVTCYSGVPYNWKHVL